MKYIRMNFLRGARTEVVNYFFIYWFELLPVILNAETWTEVLITCRRLPLSSIFHSLQWSPIGKILWILWPWSIIDCHQNPSHIFLLGRTSGTQVLYTSIIGIFMPLLQSAVCSLETLVWYEVYLTNNNTLVMVLVRDWWVYPRRIISRLPI